MRLLFSLSQFLLSDGELKPVISTLNAERLSVIKKVKNFYQMWASFHNHVDSLNPKTLQNYEEVTVLVLTFEKVASFFQF